MRYCRKHQQIQIKMWPTFSEEPACHHPKNIWWIQVPAHFYIVWIRNSLLPCVAALLANQRHHWGTGEQKVLCSSVRCWLSNTNPTSEQHGVSPKPKQHLLTLTSKAICCQQGCRTRPHPKQVATQSGQITMFTSPISILKGHLNILSTTWLASKPRNPSA